MKILKKLRCFIKNTNNKISKKFYRFNLPFSCILKNNSFPSFLARNFATVKRNKAFRDSRSAILRQNCCEKQPISKLVVQFATDNVNKKKTNGLVDTESYFSYFSGFTDGRLGIEIAFTGETK